MRSAATEWKFEGFAQDSPSPAWPQNKSPTRNKAATRKEKVEEEDSFATQTVQGIYSNMTKEARLLHLMVRSVYNEPSHRRRRRRRNVDDDADDDDQKKSKDDDAPIVDSSGIANLDQMVKHGYSNIAALMQQLQPEQRLDLIQEVDAWITSKLPEVSKLDAEMNRALERLDSKDDEKAYYDVDDSLVASHMEAFYEKLEETMRSQGHLAKDKQRLADAKLRARKLNKRSSREQQKLQEIQDEVKELRDEILGLDTSLEEQDAEAREKKRQFEENTQKLVALKGDVEVLTRRLESSKETHRLSKLTLEQFTRCGTCRVSSDLVGKLNEEALGVVGKVMDRLRADEDRIRQSRPDIQELEEESAKVEADILSYESKLDDIKKEHSSAIKKVLAAGIDGTADTLELEEVYRERAATLKRQINDSTDEGDRLESRLSVLESSIGHMMDSAHIMEDAQALFWSNVTEAIRNLLCEHKDIAVLKQTASDINEIFDTTRRKRRLDDTWDSESEKILSIFANLASEKQEARRTSLETSTSNASAPDSSNEQTQETNCDVQIEDHEDVVPTPAPLANSLEASCVDIWERIDNMREMVYLTNRSRNRNLQAPTQSRDRQGRRSKMFKGDFWEIVDKQSNADRQSLEMLRRRQNGARELADEVTALTTEYQGVRDRQAKARDHRKTFQDIRHFQVYDDDLKDLKEKVSPRDLGKNSEAQQSLENATTVPSPLAENLDQPSLPSRDLGKSSKAPWGPENATDISPSLAENLDQPTRSSQDLGTTREALRGLENTSDGPSPLAASEEMQKFTSFADKLVARAKASSPRDKLRGGIEHLQLDAKDLSRRFNERQRAAIKIEFKEEPKSAGGGAVNIG